ncbi:MAG: aminopeptidase P family protein [Halioglobus sp.]
MTSIAQRLAAVRELMACAGYDALIVPRADEYLGEYIPAHNERMQWISGFNGSAGVIIVLQDKAAIFVDGRYTVQVRREVAPQCYEYHHLLDEPPIDWLVAQLPVGARVACDPRMHSLSWYQSTQTTLQSVNMELIGEPENLVDRSWADRPEPKVGAAILLEPCYSGESSMDKRRRIAGSLVELGADAALIFAPDSVSWLLNIRGTDIDCLPVVQSFAILSADGSLLLFVDPGRVPQGLIEHVGGGIELLPEAGAEQVFARFQGLKILADPQASNAWTQLSLAANGAILIAAEDPVLLPKACKNPVEISGARRAHIRDAVAEICFLAWLDAEVAAEKLHDEATLADKLLSIRQLGELFQDSSFDTISAAGANAAMCHYNHLNGEPARLPMDSVYLLDSGAQYRDGTTDITRTIAIGNPGDEIRRMYTLVLKGHIALALARFPAGTNGNQLDVLARQFLWREGCDYDHGTGHGVGSFLSVHEAPQRIAKHNNTVALRPGMIISNEPGYYRDGCFGIRCENLVVVQESSAPVAETPMLEFETITLVPFDHRLLLLELLTDEEAQWLDRYHAKVWGSIGPLLDGLDRDWLRQATVPISQLS